MKVLELLAQQAPDLSFSLPNGTPVVRLGVIATLYYKEGYTSENKKNVMECFQRFYDEFGSHLKGQFQERYKKLTPDNFAKTRQQIEASDPEDKFEWQLTSARNAKEAGAYSLSTLNTFAMHGDAMRSYIKLVLPWEFLSEKDGVERFTNWLAYLCEQVGADHGYGGLSTILPFDYHSYMPTEFELAQQYAGLEVDSTAHISAMNLVGQIKGINWFTVLGQSFVQRLGGGDALRHAFSGRGDINILAYRQGLIIRAGHYPQLGSKTGTSPAAYVAVNGVIKPLRILEPDQLHGYSPYGNCFDKESTALWYARFDQDNCNVDAPSRIEPGQTCTKEGYWFTPAQSNSRRYFREGEIMPNFSGSNWGDTLWYWSGEE